MLDAEAEKALHRYEALSLRLKLGQQVQKAALGYLKRL